VSRENTIKLGDDELAELDVAREDIFGTDEVPYGVVVEQLCNHWQRTDKD